MIKKLLKIIFLLAFILFILGLFFYFQFQASQKFIWGATFTPAQAEYMGFDWKEMYLEILDDLKPKALRLVSYWERIEKKEGKFDFTEIDFQLVEAEKRNIKVLLVVGHKQPRWPECHHPDWFETSDENQKEDAILDFMKSTVSHLKPYKNIAYWQLENEPFFAYGYECPTISKEFFKKELALVHKLDSRPVVVTDSGEKGVWLPTAKLTDIFGSTMYRTVFDSRFNRYITYPLPTYIYGIKAGMVKIFTHINTFIGTELQAEPWFNGNVHDISLNDQTKLMNANIFKDNVDYAKKVGFAENYFWGVEWWYYLKYKHGDDSMWEAAKEVMQE